MTLMFSRISYLTLAALLVLGAHSYTHAQNQIAGQVLTENNRPIPDIYVELYNDVNRMVMRGKTDGSGRGIFRGMTTGRFIVKAKPLGTDYEEQSQEVELTNMAVGNLPSSDFQQVTLYLKTRRESTREITSAGVVFAQEIPREADNLYQRALVSLETRATETAVKQLQEALALFPDYFLANQKLGLELIGLGKMTEARKCLQKAVAVNPKAPSSWYGLAFASYALDLTGESVKAAKEASLLAPDTSEIQLMVGIALRKDQQFADAEKAMLKANKLTAGRSADVAWNLALLYAHDLNKPQLAADELEIYLKIRPEHPDAEKLRKLIKQFRST
jgi:tetratricopeptide (TPR) repeat protein